MRIQRYNEGWRFYFGKHWLFKREDGEPLVTFNYFRKIIDKAVAFLVAKGFVIKTAECLDQITKPFLDEVWEYNKRDQIIWDFGTTGGVTGDVFALMTYEEPSMMQRRVNPFSQGHIRVNLLGSEQVYPTWDPLNTDTLIAARIETIYYAERGTRQLDREDRVNHEGRQLYTKRFTQIITRDQIVEQYHGDQPVIRPNVLGEIPLVHIRNLSLPKEYYGLPDGMDLIDVQRELNEKCTDVSDIINYHACVDEETEILTKTGWKTHGDLRVGEEALGLDPDSDEITWQPLSDVREYNHVDSLVAWDNRIDAVTTPNHRWLAERRIGRPANHRFERQFVRTSESQGDEKAAEELREGSLLVVGGGIPVHFPSRKTYDDELVETIGWLVTEGCINVLPSGSQTIILSQSETANAQYVEDIRRLQAYWTGKGHTFTEQRVRESGVVCWYVGTDLTEALLDVAPDKSLSAKFLASLTYYQARNLLDLLVDADGSRTDSGREAWYQDDQGRVDSFQMLSAMVGGIRTRSYIDNRGSGVTHLFKTRTIEILSTVKSAVRVANPSGKVWCPTLRTGVWFARRGGYTYWTGNSPVTAVFGAKAKQLERSPRQIWSGLPKDARIETIKLEGDLTAAKNYIDFVKKVLHELSDTPEGSLGAEQAISNTSGVALHIQYQPLVEKTRRKRAQYEPGMEQINYFMLRIGMVKGLINLPFDLCKHCGGRIIEVDTGKTTMVWDVNALDPATNTPGMFVDQPIMKKRCYHIDKQTLDFTDPKEMRVKFWRTYGFGSELREMPLSQIIREIESQRRSYWDYTVFQEKALKEWRSDNAGKIQAAHTESVDNMTPPPAPEQSPTPEGMKAPPPPEPTPHLPPKPNALIPQITATPEKIEEPPMLKIQPLPDGEIDIPEEPEHVSVDRQYLHPDTGRVMKQITEELFLVPTGCKQPAYLNPFETKVEFNDVLPKDEALQSQLYKGYQDSGWVDEEWCQERIPEIAVNKVDINRRLKAKKAALNRMKPQQSVQVVPGAMPEQTTYMENAPPQGDQAAVPGPGGNPISMMEQLTQKPGG